MFKKHSINRVTLAALAAGVSVALVGPVQAGAVAPVRPDNRADRTFPAAEQSWPVLPDDRADRTLSDATSVGGMVTGENKRDVRLGVNYEPTLVARTPHRLDWGAPGIGAGGAFGLVVLVTVLTVAAVRYRRPAVS